MEIWFIGKHQYEKMGLVLHRVLDALRRQDVLRLITHDLICPTPNAKELEGLLRYEVFKMLKAEGKINDSVIENMMNWPPARRSFASESTTVDLMFIAVMASGPIMKKVLKI